jgi:hypothetical protein
MADHGRKKGELRLRKSVWFLIMGVILVAPIFSGSQSEKSQDIWLPFRFFIGQWEGGGQGKPGISKGFQEFSFILNGRYLHIKNKAVFEPKPNNPKGEVHEDWGFMSYDQSRKKYVLRQFHGEGFVNQYVCDGPVEDGNTFVFVTEQIENIPPGFKARLTYKILNRDEFQQTFDLAAPGKEMECYSTGFMKRKKR